jgi:ferredoxin-nitrite reductase
MDNVRNINGCALAGLTINELFDASLVLAELEQLLMHSDGNPEFTNLPRKFNVVVTGCLENCTHSESQDPALIPAIRRDRAGFNVLVGARWAPADSRSQCRFAFLIEEWGLPRLRAELVRRMGRELACAGRDVRGNHDNDHLGVAWQKQPGFRSVGLCVPEGRLNPNQLHQLARLADEYGDGQVRLTTAQNAILPNVPVERVASLLEEDLLQELSPAPSAFRRCLVACTGTDYCNLAQIDTKGQAARRAAALEKRLGGQRTPIRMHWSGCPAGCGNHEAADIGFRGFKTRIGNEMVEAVAIYVGGRTGPHAAAAQQFVEIAPCDQTLPDLVANLVRRFEGQADSSLGHKSPEGDAHNTTWKDVGAEDPGFTMPQATS